METAQALLGAGANVNAILYGSTALMMEPPRLGGDNARELRGEVGVERRRVGLERIGL